MTDQSPQQARRWSEKAKGILKSEVKKRGLTYAHLAQKLAEGGTAETEVNLRNKISRGNFSAAFFLECLNAIGCHALLLDPDAVLMASFSSNAVTDDLRRNFRERRERGEVQSAVVEDADPTIGEKT